MTSFLPTHWAPATGLSTWPAPDASQPEGPPLAPYLAVRVLQVWGDWAQVVCSNGWTTWVDGRHLVTTAPPPKSARPG